MATEIFILSEEQVENLNLCKEFIKSSYGSYGLFEYTFIPTGIGTYVSVYSKVARVNIDLSEYEKW